MTRVVQTDDGSWVSLSDLNVPPSQAGSKALAKSMSVPDSPRRYTAKVTNGTPDSSGRIRVRIDAVDNVGARLTSTAKAVRTGDMVEVAKRGGSWYVLGTETYHEPPTVSGSMGNKPPAASTASGGVSRISSGSIRVPATSSPTPPSDPTGNSNAVLYSKMLDITAHLRRLRSWLDNDAMGTIVLLMAREKAQKDSHNDNADLLASLLSVTNTNASRLNQTRDYASNAGQLVEPVVGALRGEGIVK